MITAVLDSNVLASGIAGLDNPASTPGELLRHWEGDRFSLVVSDHILAEVDRTLDDHYFQRRLTPAQIERARRGLRRRATLTPITVTVRGVATHPEDDLVLATAVSATADYLITGDTKLQWC